MTVVTVAAGAVVAERAGSVPGGSQQVLVMVVVVEPVDRRRRSVARTGTNKTVMVVEVVGLHGSCSVLVVNHQSGTGQMICTEGFRIDSRPEGGR